MKNPIADFKYLIKLFNLFNLEPYIILWKFLNKQTNLVLDIGCREGRVMMILMMISNGWISRSNIYKIGIDIYLPYLKAIKSNKLYDDLICCSAPYMPFRSVEINTILCLDLIEHLDRQSGYNLLDEMERIAKNQICILTPVGFLPQLIDDNPFQIHRSGWRITDFKTRGYKVRGLCGVSFLRGENANYRFNGILSSFSMILSHFSQIIVYFFPSIAYQILCLKDVSKAH